MNSNQRPNVLFIMDDQHNANCLGCYGNTEVKTPNLDRIAEQGVRFENAFTNNPICSPTRISIITGQHPHTHGFLGNDNYEYPGGNHDTLSALFRRYGYQTALIGKSHMIGAWDREGFEHIRYGDLCDADRDNPLNHHYFKYLVDHDLADQYEDGCLPPEHEYMKKGYAIASLPYEHSIEHWTGNETLAFLKSRDKNRPFFVHMSFERPHPNYMPAEEFLKLYPWEKITLPESIKDLFERNFATKPAFLRASLRAGGIGADTNPDELKKKIAHYYALITAIDSETGRVLQYIEEQGELSNTVIVFLSDHGDFAGEHGLMTKNLGIYESIHRIPFIIRYPGAPEGKVCRELIETVDLYPTLCELASVPASKGVEGKSIIPVINGKDKGKHYVVAEWDFPWPQERVNAIRTQRYRLVYYDRKNGGELYDRDKDPGELNNVWDVEEYRDIRIELMEMLFDHINRYALKSSFKTDELEAKRMPCSSTRLLHKRCYQWSKVKEFLRHQGQT